MSNLADGVIGPYCPPGADCDKPQYVEVCNFEDMPLGIEAGIAPIGCVKDGDDQVTGKVFLCKIVDEETQAVTWVNYLVETGGGPPTVYTGDWEDCSPRSVEFEYVCNPDTGFYDQIFIVHDGEVIVSQDVSATKIACGPLPEIEIREYCDPVSGFIFQQPYTITPAGVSADIGSPFNTGILCNEPNIQVVRQCFDGVVYIVSYLVNSLGGITEVGREATEEQCDWEVVHGCIETPLNSTTYVAEPVVGGNGDVGQATISVNNNDDSISPQNAVTLPDGTDTVTLANEFGEAVWSVVVNDPTERITNFSMPWFDIDRNNGNWGDVLTVKAYASDGQLLPATFSGTVGNLVVSGNSISNPNGNNGENIPPLSNYTTIEFGGLATKIEICLTNSQPAPAAFAAGHVVFYGEASFDIVSVEVSPGFVCVDACDGIQTLADVGLVQCQVEQYTTVTECRNGTIHAVTRAMLNGVITEASVEDTGEPCNVITPQIDVEIVCDDGDTVEIVYTDGVETSRQTIGECEPEDQFEQVRECRSGFIVIVTNEITADGTITEISAIVTSETCDSVVNHTTVRECRNDTIWIVTRSVDGNNVISEIEAVDTGESCGLTFVSEVGCLSDEPTLDLLDIDRCRLAYVEIAGTRYDTQLDENWSPSDLVNAVNAISPGTLTLTGTIISANAGQQIAEIVFGCVQTVLIEDFGTGGQQGSRFAVSAPASTTYNFDNNGQVQDGSYAITTFGDNGIGNFLKRNGGGYSPITADADGNPNGNAFLVNADFDPGEFYRRTISGLVNGNEYGVIYSMINTYWQGILPNVLVNIEDSSGAVIASGASGDVPIGQDWTKFLGGEFTSDGTDIDFVLVNNAPGGTGNDLGIDNIEFVEILRSTETMTPSGAQLPVEIVKGINQLGEVVILRVYSPDGETEYTDADGLDGRILSTGSCLAANDSEIAIEEAPKYLYITDCWAEDADTTNTKRVISVYEDDTFPLVSVGHLEDDRVTIADVTGWTITDACECK